MDLNLTAEQELIIGMVRRFVREEILPLEQHLDPDADELEEQDRLRLIEKTKEMGLYGWTFRQNMVARHRSGNTYTHCGRNVSTPGRTLCALLRHLWWRWTCSVV